MKQIKQRMFLGYVSVQRHPLSDQIKKKTTWKLSLELRSTTTTSLIFDEILENHAQAITS